MTPLIAALLVASADPRVLVLNLEAVGVEPTLAQSIDPLVASGAGSLKVNVMSQRDIQQLAEMEADKATMGCNTSSCLSELAGAMGAELVLYGTVSQLGGATVVTLSIYDQATAQVRRDVVTTKDPAELPTEVPARARKLLLEARPGLGARPPTSTPVAAATTAPPSGRGPPLVPLALIGIGAAGALGGGVLLAVSELQAGDAATDGEEKAAAQLRGRIGIGVLAVGVVVAVAGGVWLALGTGE